MSPLAFGMPGLGELWPILIVVLLLFGAKKLPELARAMGSSIHQFKKGLSDASSDEELPPKEPRGELPNPPPSGGAGAEGSTRSE